MQHTAKDGDHVDNLALRQSVSELAGSAAYALRVFEATIWTIDSCWRIWMEEQRKQENKSAADNLGEMFEALGSAMGQISMIPS